MNLIAVDDALSRILAGAGPLGMEHLPLADCLGRTLAQDLASTRTQPPFPASAMDGYALRGADVANAPVSLRLIGSVQAGAVFSGTVGAGEAVRIFTGAPLPSGADTVVIQEDASEENGAVTIREAAAPGAFVRPAGLDFASGEVLLHSGLTLQPRHLALAAAMNHPALPVNRRPRVAILATGNELVPPGQEPGPGQIVSSNSVGIAALVVQCGGQPIDLGIARDETAALGHAVRTAVAAKADILVTLGGASVGEHDLVLDALRAEGLEFGFWRIAMRPGKPLMSGRLGAMRVLGLPGNPVSAMVCGEIFLRPLISALSGRPDLSADPATAILAEGLPANDRRQDYLRARLETFNDGRLAARAFGRQDSSMLALLGKADCLIVRPPHAPAAPAGAEVPILRLDRA